MQKTSSKLISDPAHAELIAEILKAIAHPLRVRIVAILCTGPQHVNALAELLDVKQAIVSQQLKTLRLRGLVSRKREGGFAIYSLAEPNLRTLIGCMEGCSTH